MLKINLFRQFDSRSPRVILLGGFDGLHAGHRLLLARAKTLGLPVGITTIVGCKSTGDLFTPSERKRVFEGAGIDFSLETTFESIKNLSPEQFVALLEDGRDVAAFVCGEDFRFGAGAQGDYSTLEKLGRTVYVEPILLENGEKVGASSIKKALEVGDAQRAKKLLGEPFFLEGIVEEDRKIGRTIGFPTANIRYPSDKFPIAKGVYQTSATIDGKTYKGITNYGSRPTFSDGEIWTETHFISYVGDLYCKKLKINFERRLRDIRKFASAAALKEQLEKDVRRVTEDD